MSQELHNEVNDLNGRLGPLEVSYNTAVEAQTSAKQAQLAAEQAKVR